MSNQIKGQTMKSMKLVLLLAMTAVAGSMRGMEVFQYAMMQNATSADVANSTGLNLIGSAMIAVAGAIPTAATLYHPMKVMMKWAEDDLVDFELVEDLRKHEKATMAAQKLFLGRIDKSLGEATEDEAADFYASRVQPLVAFYKKLESQKENAVTPAEAQRIIKFMALLEEYSKVGDARLGKIKLELGAKTAGAEESKENS